MRILIITVPDDVHADAVSWGLRKMGHEPVIWQWPRFPQEEVCTIQFEPGISGIASGLSWSVGGTRHRSPFDVIWRRRTGQCSPMAGTHAEDIPVVERESADFIRNFLSSLGTSNARWVNELEADERCTSKLFQLSTAAECGFKVPETLMSNDPAAVRAFCRKHQGRLIHKGFRPAVWHNNDGSRTSMYTAAISYEHLENDFAIRACPAIYQPLIEKRHELRVTVMGDVVLAGMIDSQKHGPSIDWRWECERSGEANLVAMTLQPELSARCLQLCRRMGLEFGCIDLIVTPSGETIFLEINHGGAFLWKELADPTLPMLHSFCKMLAGSGPGDEFPDISFKFYLESTSLGSVAQ